MTSNETNTDTEPTTVPPKQEGETEAMVETSPPSSPSSQSSKNKKSDAARYAALRNHRIRLEDAIDPDAERVSKIHKKDILFGRGKGFQNHPGNQRMREIVEKYKIKYHTLRRTEKQDLIEAVYVELTGKGARFLKKLEKEDVWVNVDHPVALQKVSHTLRCRKGVLDRVMNEEAHFPVSKLVAPGAFNQQQHHHLLPTTLTGLHASYTPTQRATSPSLEARRFAVSNSLSGLEVQRLAALERFRTLTTMPFLQPPAQGPTLMDHYNSLRREQIMREMLVFQQQQQLHQNRFAAMPGMGLHLALLAAPSNVPSAPTARAGVAKSIVN